jgi:hypothetical protein
MNFDPWNCSLKIWKSIGIPTPKVGAHLRVRVHSITHSYISGSMKCDSWASLSAYAFTSPCLGCEPKARFVTKKHWKKQKNKKTTCEVITSVVNVPTTTRCLPKHMKKLIVNFTCEGKSGLLWNINIQETWFCTTFVTLHNIPSWITTPLLYPMHFIFLASKQTNEHKKKSGNVHHDVISYWSDFNYDYQDHATKRIEMISMTSGSIIHTDLHKPNKKLVSA